MVQISRFWDGTTLGDATVAPYDAGTEFSEVMSAISGAAATPDKGGAIKTSQGELAISSPSAGVVRIGAGEGMSYGAWYKSDTAVDHSFATPAAAARIDRIVLRKSWGSQTVRQLVVTGAEGGGTPALTQIVGDTWDVPIATINIATNGNITITDNRYILGTPPTDQILTDPIIRDTAFFGAKPAGIADASLRRVAAGQLAMPNQVLTVGIMQADGPLAQERAAKFLTGGVMRWFVGIAGGQTESGGNSGSELGIYRYADNGTFLGQVMNFNRANGTISALGPLLVSSYVWFGGGAGQRIADEAGTLVLRRPDAAATMTLDNAGNLNAMGAMAAGGNIQAGGNMTAIAGRVQAGSSASLFSTMDWNGIFTAHGGQHITLNPTSGYVIPVNGTVRLGADGNPFNDITTAGSIRGVGGVFPIVAAANIQLQPAGGIVHPSGDANLQLGAAGLEWAIVYSRRFYSASANPLNIEAGNGSVQVFAHGSGSPVNLFSDSGQMQFQTGDGFAIMPLRHNTVNMGSNSLRWIQGFGVGGWNSGSTREWKQNWSDLPEGQALAALRLMKFGRFEYKLPDSVLGNKYADPAHKLTRWSVGYIAEDTVEVTGLVGGEDLFVSKTGRDVEPQRTASTIGAAVQDLDRELHEEISELRQRIAELEQQRERVYANDVS